MLVFCPSAPSDVDAALREACERVGFRRAEAPTASTICVLDCRQGVEPISRLVADTAVPRLQLIVLALVGSAMQDRKKQHQLGTAWSGWQSRTSYFPRPAGFAAIRPVMWLGAFALWLLINWLHMPLGGIAAGFWRWLG